MSICIGNSNGHVGEGSAVRCNVAVATAVTRRAGLPPPYLYTRPSNAPVLSLQLAT